MAKIREFFPSPTEAADKYAEQALIDEVEAKKSDPAERDPRSPKAIVDNSITEATGVVKEALDG